jgi:hypothetical protein
MKQCRKYSCHFRFAGSRIPIKAHVNVELTRVRNFVYVPFLKDKDTRNYQTCDGLCFYFSQEKEAEKYFLELRAVNKDEEEYERAEALGEFDDDSTPKQPNA